MDFNEIKNTWKDSYKKETLLSKEQIGALLRIKSNSNTALNKIKRSSKFELIGGALMYLIIIGELFMYVNTPDVFIIIALITLFMVFFYYSALRNLNRIINTAISGDQLKPTLINTINTIEKHVNFGGGNFFKFFLIPFSIVFGLAIGIYIGSGDKSIIETIYSLKSKSIIKIILVIVIGSGITIPFSQYMNKRMYQQHLDELKQYLKEFEETDNI